MAHTKLAGPGVEKYSRDPAVRAGAHTVGAAAVSIGLIFSSTVVISRELGPTAKGVFDLAVAASSLLALAVGFALPTGITFAIAKRVVSPRRTIRVAFLVSLAQIVGAATILVVARNSGVIAAMLPSDLVVPVIAIIALGTGITALSASLKAVCVGLGRIIRANVADVTGKGALVVGCLLAGFIADGHPDVLALLIVWIGSMLVSVVGFGVVGTEAPLATASREGLRTAVRIALPSWATNVIQYLNYRLDLFLVALFLTTADVGTYALAGSVAQLVWVLSNSAAMVLYPAVASGENAINLEARASTIARLAVASGAFLAIVLGLFAAPLVHLVFGPQFDGATVAIWWLLPGIVVFTSANVLAAYIAGLGRPELNGIASGISLLVTFVLDVTLIPRFGIAGAAAASSCSYAVATVIVAAVYSRLTGQAWYQQIIPRKDDVMVAMAMLQARTHSRSARR